MDVKNELKDAIQTAMKDSGDMDAISAKVRAEIYRLLTKDAPRTESVPIIEENMIINELIREYLTFNGYESTISVFVDEAGQPDEPIDKNFLASTLNLPPSNQPLLYAVARQDKYGINPAKPKVEHPIHTQISNESNEEESETETENYADYSSGYSSEA